MAALTMTSQALSFDRTADEVDPPALFVGSLWFVPGPSADAEVIDLLRQSGSDLTMPHPVEFLLGGFPCAAGARRVAAWLAVRGLTVSLSLDEDASRYSIVAGKLMVPRQHEMESTSRYLSALAAAEGGDYEGW